MEETKDPDLTATVKSSFQEQNSGFPPNAIKFKIIHPTLQAGESFSMVNVPNVSQHILSEMAVGHLAANVMKGFLPFNYKNIHTNASLAYHAVTQYSLK